LPSVLAQRTQESAPKRTAQELLELHRVVWDVAAGVLRERRGEHTVANRGRNDAVEGLADRVAEVLAGLLPSRSHLPDR
jgi:hypothetical protein